MIATNDAPVADNDSYTALAGNALHVDATKGVLNGDLDADSLQFAATLASAPAHGQLTFKADGSFDYVPEPGFEGTDSFTYVANDGAADSNIATVSINVAAQPDPWHPHEFLLV